MNETKIKLPGVDNYFVEEAFNVLRTNIQFCGQDVKVIALTSVTQNEGKTVLALHLGRSLSELGKRVLVIDADLRKSVMAGRNSSSKSVMGLSEAVTGMVNLEDCIYSTQYPRLDVLFSGKYPPNPVELLNGRYFDELIKAVCRVYDYVIIDTPPLGMVIDAAVIAAHCDSALLVIGSNNIHYRDAQEVVNQLEKSGCNVLGVVLNNANDQRKGYYHKRYSNGYYAYGAKYESRSDKKREGSLGLRSGSKRETQKN